MKTTVTNPTDTTAKLTITLGESELKDAEQVALVRLGHEIKVPGFRKGKAPASVAAKHVDPNHLAEHALDAAINLAVATAFKDENIQALDRPNVEVTKYVPSSELEFTAEVEILPKVKLGDYKHLKAKLTPAKVEAADVNETIDRIRKSMSERADVKRAAKDGDEVTIDFVGKKDDVAFDGGTATDYPLVLGSHSFIPGFEKAIVGHKIGETFDVKLSFPDDYHVADLKGQPVVFATTIKKISEVQLPELSDEFAAKAGPFTSVKELKDDIKRELTAQRERDAKDKLKDELVGELVDKSTVPAPESLVHDQIHSIEEDMQQNLTYQNITLEQYLEANGFKDKDDWEEKEVRPAATKRVQAGLLLAELKGIEKVTATEKEIDEHVALYKTQYANNPEMVKRFDEPEVRQDIANRLLTEKTVDRLVELNAK